ncbi:unnamed protein product [Acanthoscelides obtectus]|uniref:N-acetylglucosaminylphosphatidylinositol deacetylase n=1 Tax=Acanthoscelides obtectus TaxID=200917 RepID=A0A9P0NWW1_ACAOB|nr:unnamed protein product [Acanthoscelides obtectus]CAK1641392.1 Probable N-acetylglucosaminyl-phosphatidylinositol de-N-acetylase [Acanthoscelides obtectus]
MEFNLINICICFVYLVDTAGHLGIACILYVLLNILLYILIIRWGVVSFNRNARNFKRVLFVIAHPDDECMFFGPTILNYTRKENCTVYLMCLSTVIDSLCVGICKIEEFCVL